MEEEKEVTSGESERKWQMSDGFQKENLNGAQIIEVVCRVRLHNYEGLHNTSDRIGVVDAFFEDITHFNEDGFETEVQFMVVTPES